MRNPWKPLQYAFSASERADAYRKDKKERKHERDEQLKKQLKGRLDSQSALPDGHTEALLDSIWMAKEKLGHFINDKTPDYRAQFRLKQEEEDAEYRKNWQEKNKKVRSKVPPDTSGESSTYCASSLPSPCSRSASSHLPGDTDGSISEYPPSDDLSIFSRPGRSMCHTFHTSQESRFTYSLGKSSKRSKRSKGATAALIPIMY